MNRKTQPGVTTALNRRISDALAQFCHARGGISKTRVLEALAVQLMEADEDLPAFFKMLTERDDWLKESANV